MNEIRDRPVCVGVRACVHVREIGSARLIFSSRDPWGAMERNASHSVNEMSPDWSWEEGKRERVRLSEREKDKNLSL